MRSFYKEISGSNFLSLLLEIHHWYFFSSVHTAAWKTWLSASLGRMQTTKRELVTGATGWRLFARIQTIARGDFFESLVVSSVPDAEVLSSYTSELALPTYAYLASTTSSPSLDITAVLDHVMTLLESDAVIKQMIPEDDQENFLDLMRSQLNLGMQKWSKYTKSM